MVTSLTLFSHGSVFAPQQRMPPGHSFFSVSPVARSAGQKKPSSHVSQNDVPTFGWNLPTGHAVHLPAVLLALEKRPTAQGAHVRSSALETSTSMCAPGAHSRASANGYIWEEMQKWSAGQGSHVPLVELPNSPASHAASHATAPGCEKRPQSQRVQGSSSRAALKRPAVQSAQLELSGVVEAWPTGQTALASSGATHLLAFVAPLPYVMGRAPSSSR